MSAHLGEVRCPFLLERGRHKYGKTVKGETIWVFRLSPIVIVRRCSLQDVEFKEA